MTLLETVKKSLLIPLEETYADDELDSLIRGCRELIRSTGVDDATVDGDDTIVTSLVLIYCKTFFGFKGDGSVKELPSSFDLLLRQLALTKGGGS
jgi:hypothetical protein